LHALSALEKIESWFNSLSDEDKMDFAKKHPAFVTPVLRN